MNKFRTYNFYICLLVTCLVYLNSSCKKNDLYNSSVKQQTVSKNLEKEFFKIPAKTSPTVQRIITRIAEQNNQYHFVNDVANREGLPVWNKARIQLPGKSTITSGFQHGNSANQANGGEDTLVFVPLVLQNTMFVNAFLACAVGDSVNIRLIHAGDYAQYGFNNIPDSINADRVALQTMLLEMDVFGHDEYELLDSRLFNHVQDGITYHPQFCKIGSSTTTVTPSLMVQVTSCTQMTISGGWLTGCPPGVNCNNVVTYTVCDTYFFFIDENIGGGGGGYGYPWWIPGGAGSPPNGGGGGGSGTIAWVYVPPVLTPCQVVDSLMNIPDYKIFLDDFKSKTADHHETAIVMLDPLINPITYDTTTGPENDLGVNYNPPIPVNGVLHNHYNSPDRLTIFSLDDLVKVYLMLTDHEIINAKTFTLGLVTDSSSYILMIDSTQFKQFGDTWFSDSISLIEANNIYFKNYNIAAGNSAALNEYNFLKLVTSLNMGIKLFRGNSTLTQFTPIRIKDDGLSVETATNCVFIAP